MWSSFHTDPNALPPRHSVSVTPPSLCLSLTSSPISGYFFLNLISYDSYTVLNFSLFSEPLVIPSSDQLLKSRDVSTSAGERVLRLAASVLLSVSPSEVLRRDNKRRYWRRQSSQLTILTGFVAYRNVAYNRQPLAEHRNETRENGIPIDNLFWSTYLQN